MKKSRLFDLIIRVCIFPLNIIIKFMSIDHQKKAHLHILKGIHCDSYYVTLSYFPKKQNMIQNAKGTDGEFSDYAIVLQGPVKNKDDFTLETIKMYKKFYNGINIIVSTWKSENPQDLEKIRKENVVVIESEVPSVSGVGNINYQLKSSLVGCKKADSLGARYCWKTRTDQRFYNPCALSLLSYILDKKRMVFLGGVNDSFIKRYFQLSDFMTFGKTKDLILLYGCPFDSEDIRKSKYTHKHQSDLNSLFSHYIDEVWKAEENCTYNLDHIFDDYSIKYANPETILAFHFYEVINSTHKSLTIEEQYKDMLLNYISIVDADSLGFFWNKYDFSAFKEGYYDRPARLDFARWSSLFNTTK